MRKLLVSLCVLALAVCGTSTLFASGIDNLSNMSADFIRTMNRTHSTDLDAVVYNPAGTTALKKGLSVGFNVQQAYKVIQQNINANDWYNGSNGSGVFFTGSTSCTDGANAALTSSANSAIEEFKSTVPSTIPSLFMAYNTGDFAGFFAFSIPAGGGTVKFDEGAVYLNDLFAGLVAKNSVLKPANITNLALEASSQYYGFTLGGAYNVVNDLVSVSAAGRFIFAQRTAKMEGNFNMGVQANALLASMYGYNVDAYEDADTAKGFGGIVGINITPTKELRLSLRYETVTRLVFKKNIRRLDTSLGSSVGNAIVTGGSASALLTQRAIHESLRQSFAAPDGELAARDLPPVASFGFSYAATSEFMVFGSASAYFNKDARWQTFTSDTTNTDAVINKVNIQWYNRGDKHLEKKAGTTWDAGLGFEFAVTKELKLSAGWLYTHQVNAESVVGVAAENPAMNSNTIGAGLQFDAGSGLLFSFGVSDTIYQERKTTYYTDKWHNDLGYFSKDSTSSNGNAKSVTFNRSAWTVALGVTYNLAM